MSKLEYLIVTLAIVLAIIVGILFSEAMAGGKDITINNYYENNHYTTPAPTVQTASETTNLTLTSGISDSDLAEGLAGAMAIGGHQFDFSTHQFQGSITAGLFDSEEAYSIGIGKRFKKIDALFHGAATQIGSENAFVVGGTFRF